MPVSSFFHSILYNHLLISCLIEGDKMVKSNVEIICKNVFKNSDNKTIRTAFTQKFIELINQLEKTKVSTPKE